MNRKIFIIGLISLACAGGFAAKAYRYKCPKCKLIQEYKIPGTKKCPNDGRIMIREN
jgi:hypothetical protein